MRRIAAVSAGTLLAVLLVHAAAVAQGSRTARGTVVTAAADAVTVKVGDKDMTFKVDAKTQVTARGGATATREARAQGKEGVAYTSIVKPGQGVEVTYTEPGLLATNIRVLPGGPPPPAAAGARAQTANGVVTAVTSSSLSIKGSGGESTYTIDEKTRVVGRGVGTKSDELKKAGEKAQISTFVRTGDSVTVTYTEEGGTRRASEVRVSRAAKE
jgi:hypothetical protein